jgi:hypothetical protein
MGADFQVARMVVCFQRAEFPFENFEFLSQTSECVSTFECLLLGFFLGLPFCCHFVLECFDFRF